MVSLEALREGLVDLDYEIDDLYDCISDNDSEIEINQHGIEHNDEGIEENEEEIDDQRRRISRAQKKCRRCQAANDEDRDFLIMYCQQFAFSPDMVGACADILVCKDTRLGYRAEVFNVQQYA